MKAKYKGKKYKGLRAAWAANRKKKGKRKKKK